MARWYSFSKKTSFGELSEWSINRAFTKRRQCQNPSLVVIKETRILTTSVFLDTGARRLTLFINAPNTQFLSNGRIIYERALMIRDVEASLFFFGIFGLRRRRDRRNLNEETLTITPSYLTC